MDLNKCKIAVVGLGYVGLPLAVEFGKQYTTIGFDINQSRVSDLEAGIDVTGECTKSEMVASKKLSFCSDEEGLRSANVYIVTVPTPIDIHKNPDLSPLENASQIVGKFLQPEDIVIYESTVYPGATEEVCIPVLEAVSSLRFNEDFFAGYSPERINPGDKTHRLTSIKKVTSGSNPKIRSFVDDLYGSIITAGTHSASSLKVAEAAKVIENTQRDLNIALINELAIIFGKLGIDTNEVLEAAGTKWNFLPFRPGLVGGHCIGVDPYYLTYKAKSIGYHPEVILAGRKINDGMGSYVANRLIKAMINKKIDVSKSRILIMGITFKENCPDVRNSKVIDIVAELETYSVSVQVHDPFASKIEVKDVYGIDLIDDLEENGYDGIIVAVAHDIFVNAGIDTIKGYSAKLSVIFDLKSVYESSQVDLQL